MGWEQLFGAFFAKDGLAVKGLLGEKQNPSDALLDAGGCRELWVQGEAFRHFRSQGLNFKTNELWINGSASRADFAVLTDGTRLRNKDGKYRSDLSEDILMVAELKVLGYDYEDKIVCGPFNRAPEEMEGTRQIRQDPQKQIPSQTWNVDDSKAHGHSLEGAYRKLLAFDAPKAEKWLLLILDRRSQGKDRLGNLLDTVDFEVTHPRKKVIFLEIENLRIVGWHL